MFFSTRFFSKHDFFFEKKNFLVFDLAEIFRVANLKLVLNVYMCTVDYSKTLT